MTSLHRAIDGLSEETLAKIRRLKGEAAGVSDAFTPSEMLLAEFGHFYGWDAVKDALEGRVTWRTFQALLEAGRAIKKRERAELVADIFDAVACSRVKNGDKKVNEKLRQIVK